MAVEICGCDMHQPIGVAEKFVGAGTEGALAVVSSVVEDIQRHRTTAGDGRWRGIGRGGNEWRSDCWVERPADA